MAVIVLFHHVQGLTSGVRAFANQLRSAGHEVYTPDLFDGQTFASIDEGLAYVQPQGMDAFIARGVQSVASINRRFIVAGFSLGVLPTQQLAQTDARIQGAVLMHACVPAEAFGGWPVDLPVQIHAMSDDPFFVDDGDKEAAQALVQSTSAGELFVYPGDKHLFADNSLTDYDVDAAHLMIERVSTFVDINGVN